MLTFSLLVMVPLDSMHYHNEFIKVLSVCKLAVAVSAVGSYIASHLLDSIPRFYVSSCFQCQELNYLLFMTQFVYTSNVYHKRSALIGV